MSDVNIILWAIGGGFAGTWAMMFWAFSNLGVRIDKLDSRIDKLDEKITDIDRRICRLEGAFSSKDCCFLKDDTQLKKAE